MNKQIKPPHILSEPSQLTLLQVLQMGIDLTKSSFRSVYLYSFFMICIVYALQFQTSPTVSDISDVIGLLVIAFTIWILASLHTTMIMQMDSIIQGHSLPFKQAIHKGMKKSIPVFILCLLYIALITFAWMLTIQTKQLAESSQYPEIVSYAAWAVFILPLIIFSVSFYLASFIVVLRKSSKHVQHKKIISYSAKSLYLLKAAWWKMLALMLLSVAAMFIIWGIYQVLLKELVIFSILFFAAACALVLTFWYGSVLALILELKARKMEKLENLLPSME